MKLDVVRSQLLRECTESRETLGQDKQRDNIFKSGNFLCLSCASASLALHHSGFVPREWPAAKTQRGHCYLYHTDTSAIRHYSVGLKQFSWNVSLLRRGLFVRLGEDVRGGRWEGKIAVCGSERCWTKPLATKNVSRFTLTGYSFFSTWSRLSVL